LLTSCGFLIYRGSLHSIPAFASALAGSMCGITCSYIIGRTLGWKFLHSRAGRMLHVRDEQIRWVHDWFNRIGHWALMIGYFVPGVRHFTAIVAGTSKLEYPGFAAFAYTVGEHVSLHRISFRSTLGGDPARDRTQSEAGFGGGGSADSRLWRVRAGAAKALT
jgi:hypothetical protein